MDEQAAEALPHIPIHFLNLSIPILRLLARLSSIRHGLVESRGRVPGHNPENGVPMSLCRSLSALEKSVRRHLRIALAPRTWQPHPNDCSVFITCTISCLTCRILN
jgi:hypothetical protein